MRKPDSLVEATENHLIYSYGKRPEVATLDDVRNALSLAVRDRIVAPWHKSINKSYEGGHKKVYYLSLEFLMGRLLEDALVNLGIYDEAHAAVKPYGFELPEVLESEPDAALGNGGLGRLAAGFLDSLATLGVPAIGYGIRYENGIFRQEFQNGQQVERPEDWLSQEHPWEFMRHEISHEIYFGGDVTKLDGKDVWRPRERVIAMGYDTPVIGWQGKWANALRLWEARSTRVLDLQAFNRGDFTGASASETTARTISRVLYPDDTTQAGKELRLKQEYFFTAASLADILRRFFNEHDDVRKLPDHVAIQLNDTHPAIAGPELIRVLVDVHGVTFDDAVDIAQRTLNYTNHTLLPEALERWSTYMMGTILPRHMQIIEQIDAWHRAKFPNRPEHTGLIVHHEVLMGNLAFILANRVNGVSALHTDLVKSSLFADLNALHPNRIVNQTNGITPVAGLCLRTDRYRA